MFQSVSDFIYQNPAVAAVCVSALVAICIGIYIQATLPYYILNGAFIFFLIYAGIFNLDIEFSRAVSYYIVIVAVITFGVHHRVSWWYYALAAVLLFVWLFLSNNFFNKKKTLPYDTIRVNAFYETEDPTHTATASIDTFASGTFHF